MNPFPLDDDLCDGLGPETAEYLSTWAVNARTSYALRNWLTGGLSGAKVCVVDEIGRDRVMRRLILKVEEFPKAAIDGRLGEYGRHSDALHEAPKGFAWAHLTELVYGPIPVGLRRLALFQQVVGADVGEFVLLGALLDGARASEGRAHAEDFTVACETVVRSVLADWAEKPRALSAEGRERWRAGKDGRVRVSDFLDVSLAEWPAAKAVTTKRSEAIRGNYIAVEGEPRKLPNPLAVVAGETLIAGHEFLPLMGKAHGDLHIKNILLPVDPARSSGADPAAYRLVDLAKYRQELPLTGDPVYLILYVIARVMPDLSHSQRDALVDLLTRPASGAAHLIPGWLAGFITRVIAVARGWAGESRMARDWDEQSLLSMVAHGLVYWARGSTRPEDQEWFLRLSGRALAEYQRAVLPMAAAAAPPREPPTSKRTADPNWIAQFCGLLPELRRRAAGTELVTEVEALVAAAQLGDDATDRLDALIRRMDDLNGGGLRHVPGLRGGWPLMEDAFACPTGFCPRLDTRQPTHGVPLCHIPQERRMTLRRR
ncbi:hypothetical protein Acor_13950 [Acrocarpospora corrugata]|uniref:Uncharacterized protein n=1 Tax=Acrocarpospora corrugata TaxID=35763 RepID=A0A5M3VUH7_9ACTN|nr:hypothetical protein [Acrocarpospora corrugata]GER99331.1 hypothetical protein Acor_13950 [Acrocarpospora corrugata]